MSVHMQRDLDKLKRGVLSLCALVEEQVRLAVQALVERDESLAHTVEQRDREIDRREVEIEEDCLKILALYQPVAMDLRYVVAIMKIDSDLERIGDLAVNIAHKASAFSGEPFVEIGVDLPYMAGQVQGMLADSLDAMVNFDARMADEICARDSEIDGLKRENRLRVEELIRRSPERVHAYLLLMAAARNLERIADHATNIARDVIYMIRGDVVRHREITAPCGPAER
jgi:phosphate transport system protein